MKSYRVLVGFLILVSLNCILVAPSVPVEATPRKSSIWPSFIDEASFYHLLDTPILALAGSVNTDATGINEVVPQEYRHRYERWKSELLATEYGQRLWKNYSENTRFLLTIVVSGKRKFGAGTDSYEWDDSGRLIAATITIGKDLDRGFPEPIYYPAMNSLSVPANSFGINGNILASTKIAHEMGHVNLTAQSNSKVIQRQDKLMAAYYKIFLNNGYNTKDPRLVDLSKELGREPIEVWEDREYWSEVSAMKYLVERIDKESYYCSVLNKFRRNVSNYARSYQDRFQQFSANSSSGPCTE